VPFGCSVNVSANTSAIKSSTAAAPAAHGPLPDPIDSNCNKSFGVTVANELSVGVERPKVVSNPNSLKVESTSLRGVTGVVENTESDLGRELKSPSLPGTLRDSVVRSRGPPSQDLTGEPTCGKAFGAAASIELDKSDAVGEPPCAHLKDESVPAHKTNTSALLRLNSKIITYVLFTGSAFHASVVTMQE
jgi:hypothetical protein